MSHDSRYEKWGRYKERDVSHEHADKFLLRERQAVEQLAAEMGTEVVKKLDRLLIRDLIRERNERVIEKVFAGADQHDSPPPRRHRVMITMRSAKPEGGVMFAARPDIRSRLEKSRPVRRKDLQRRLFVEELRRSNEFTLQRLEADVKERGAEVKARYWLTASVVTEVDTNQLQHLAAREDVENVVVLKLQLIMCLDVSRPLIQADQVQTSLGFDGGGVVVAVIDTGVDATHPALAGAVISQQDFTGAGMGDGVGHGSHCAGVIASRDRTFRGIAPAASIADFRIMDAVGASNPDWAVAAIQAAVTAGVDVASNSWGWSHGNGAWTDPDGTCSLCRAADAAVAAGVVFVVAAGNEDNDTCSSYDTHLRCPGMAHDVLTVAASDDSDNMASFSSLGPTPDGRAKPDITAPGVGIVSVRATGTSMGTPFDANFTAADGTSMACPHVAGVAALMLDKNGGTTPANVSSIVMSTAVNIGATANEMGAGRVDALAAVNATP